MFSIQESELNYWNDRVEKLDPEAIMSQVYSSIKNITLACSFGPEDMVLIDMIAKGKLPIPVFYIDTQLLFAETYGLRDVAIEYYRAVDFIQVLPTISLEEQERAFGMNLYATRPDECCSLRKVRPLEQHLKQFDGWITGIRREQSPTRANAHIVEQDHRFGLVKVNPLALWSHEQVWDYINQHGVPYNPLHDHGYPSIGCSPCTQPVKEGDDPRSGRWSGFAKTECGLHTEAGESL